MEPHIYLKQIFRSLLRSNNIHFYVIGALYLWMYILNPFNHNFWKTMKKMYSSHFYKVGFIQIVFSRSGNKWSNNFILDITSILFVEIHDCTLSWSVLCRRHMTEKVKWIKLKYELLFFNSNKLFLSPILLDAIDQFFTQENSNRYYRTHFPKFILQTFTFIL